MDGLKNFVKNAVKNGKSLTNYYRNITMTTPDKKNTTAPTTVDSSELKKENYADIIKQLTNILGADTKTNILNKTKEIMSDAVDIYYDNKLSPGTYQIVDINNVCIAYAWFDEKDELVLIPQYGSEVLKNRVN